MMPTIARWLLCVLICCAAIAGCGRAQRWPALTEPTTAVVRLDGKPVKGALVMLGPVGKGYASQGTTAADGKATLTTFSRGDGAVAGRYRVLVSSEEVRDNPALKFPDPAIDREAYDLARHKAAAAGQHCHVGAVAIDHELVARLQRAAQRRHLSNRASRQRRTGRQAGR